MRFRYFAVLVLQLILSYFAFGNENTIRIKEKNVTDTIQIRLDFLKKYFSDSSSWVTTDPEFNKNIGELIRFIEGQPIDTILKNLSFQSGEVSQKVIRFRNQVADSLNIPGYIPFQEMEKQMKVIEKSARRDSGRTRLDSLSELLYNLEKGGILIPKGQGMILFKNSVYTLPDSLKTPEIVSEAMIQSPDDFKRIFKLDSLRLEFIEKKRIHYNDSVLQVYRDSASTHFVKTDKEELVRQRVKEYADSVNQNNANLIAAYNNEVVRLVNDSIKQVISDLTKYANQIDSTVVYIQNSDNTVGKIVLGRNENNYTRVWIKNQQNDSISILVQNADKSTLRMMVDDNATINRFSKKKYREISFENLHPSAVLANIRERFKIETPWSIGGNGNIGFTQTFQSNWSKGGKSAISMLLVLKGFANYSAFDGKIKWENSGEIRNGWMRTGSDISGKKYESQKNDDKFEVISRLGFSAFKEWYYSAEVDFETQFFYGYKYPISSNPDPISGFLAPAKTLFKIGMDYKPGPNLSVFLSPFTSKSVYIRDTVKINKANFNIPQGKKALWVPGLNADVTFKTSLGENISYETKYKMFIDYTAPFEKFDINWENLVVMKVNNFIDVRFMLHLIYDDDILFPVTDSQGNVLYSRPKLQVKELVTVGFSYKINKKVYRTRQIN